jgi:hypothetical protein
MKIINYTRTVGLENTAARVEICCPDTVLADHEAMAQAESVDGIYTVTDAPDEPSALTVPERLDALEKQTAPGAYQPGTWYYRGDRVSLEGTSYTCVAPAGVVCVWSPAEYPTYWQEG